MHITEEQLNDVRQGKAVHLSESDTSIVLLRADMFERLRHLIDDDAICTNAEMVDRIMAADDQSDPYLAELQLKYGGQR
jgi:hypothetical protein